MCKWRRIHLRRSCHACLKWTRQVSESLSKPWQQAVDPLILFFQGLDAGLSGTWAERPLCFLKKQACKITLELTNKSPRSANQHSLRPNFPAFRRPSSREGAAGQRGAERRRQSPRAAEGEAWGFNWVPWMPFMFPPKKWASHSRLQNGS